MELLMSINNKEIFMEVQMQSTSSKYNNLHFAFD